MRKNHYKLFFPWQSDVAESRKILSLALDAAVEELRSYGINLEVDHSTLGEVGMPSIDHTIQEDDGATKICGRLIKMKREYIDTRCRFLTDYNFIIAAKGSSFNNSIFDQTSEYYFNGLLDGTISIDDFHEYLMQFPKCDRGF